MPASILTQGLTAIRDALKTTFTNQIAVTDDTTAFAAAQTRVNPTTTGTTLHFSAPTYTNVDATTYDATIIMTAATANGFVSKVINTVGAQSSTAPTSATARVVRPTGMGIGFISGDVLEVGLRVAVTDQS